MHRQDIQAHKVKVGILLILLGIFMYAFLDVGLKWYVERFSAVQLVFFRCLFSFIPLLYFLKQKGGRRQLITFRPLAQFSRAVWELISLLLFIISLSYIPLLDATAIYFTGPILIAALSVPLLNEQVGIYRWTAIIVGFIGGLFVIQPGFGDFHFGALFALGAAIFYALGTISTRQLSRTDPAITSSFWTTVIWTVCTFLCLPFFWTNSPDIYDIFGLVIIGFCGGLGHYFITTALSNITPTVAAPYEYSALVWATIFGFFIWSEVPNIYVVVGTFIISLSGLYILHRETLHKGKVKYENIR